MPSPHSNFHNPALSPKDLATLRALRADLGAIRRRNVTWPEFYRWAIPHLREAIHLEPDVALDEAAATA